MKQCMFCGRTYPDDNTICPACGQRLETEAAGRNLSVEINSNEVVPDYSRPYRESDPLENARTATERLEYAQPVSRPFREDRAESAITIAETQKIYLQNQKFYLVQMVSIAIFGLSIIISSVYNRLYVNGKMVIDSNLKGEAAIGMVFFLIGCVYAKRAADGQKNPPADRLQSATQSKTGFVKLYGVFERPVVRGKLWPALLASMLTFILTITTYAMADEMLHPLILHPENAQYCHMENITGLIGMVSGLAAIAIYTYRLWTAAGKGSQLYQELP